MGASWSVEYTDGTCLQQWVNSQEVPYSAIEWSRVARLTLAADHLQETFDLRRPGPEYQLSLRSRHFKALQGEDTMFFVLLLSDAGKPVESDTVRWAFYWSPIGVMHECDLFDCPDVRHCATQHLSGQPVGLMPLHTHIDFAASGTLQ